MTTSDTARRALAWLRSCSMAAARVSPATGWRRLVPS